jgi:hypothetical protein
MLVEVMSVDKIIKFATPIPRMETIATTAKLFGLPEFFVRSKVLDGSVVAVSAGRKYLVNVDKFAEYLNSSKIEQEDVTTTSIRPIAARR